MSSDEFPKRLCNEIKLFNLCSLNDCKNKDAKFCTDQNLLLIFNNICNQDEDQIEVMDEEYEDGLDVYPGDPDEQWRVTELYRGITYDLLFLSVHNKPYTNWEIYHERLAFSCYRNSWRSNRNIRIKI